MNSSEHTIANACAEKFKRAQKGIREAQVAFEELDSTLEEAWKEEWLAEETEAQSVKSKKLAKLYEPRISGEKGKSPYSPQDSALLMFFSKRKPLWKCR